MRLKLFVFLGWLLISILSGIGVNILLTPEAHPKMIYINFLWTEVIISAFAFSTYRYIVGNDEDPGARWDIYFPAIISTYGGFSVGLLVLNAYISIDYENVCWIMGILIISLPIFLASLGSLSFLKKREIQKEVSQKNAELRERDFIS